MTNTQVRMPAPPARSRRGRVYRLIAGAAAALALAVGLYCWYQHTLDRDLLDAIAEADRLDPGWRFEDLEAARAAVPDAENGAVLVQAAATAIPPNWLAPPPGGAPGLDERLEDVPLPHRPDDALLDELRDELEKVAAALDRARQLADRPRGRYAVAWSPLLIATLMPHLEKPRVVARLLVFDSVLRSVDGDGDGAVRSCQAALNAGRSLGDEPAWVSQLVRRACVAEAVHALEGVLARCEAGAKSLEEMQRLLLAEAAEPSLLISARSVRVMDFQALDDMRTRKFDRLTFKLMPSWLGHTGDSWLDATKARAVEAGYLRYWNAFVEIVKGPAETQEEQLRQLAVPDAPLPPLLAGLKGKTDWVQHVRGFHFVRARLHCAAAALAAERYRLAKGRWPESLDALVPAFLAEVPADPFDGRPLRLRRLPDGLVIYSVGPDRTDDGGKLDRKQSVAPGADIGFQLWDPARRGWLVPR
jgi:hypothetical protein